MISRVTIPREAVRPGEGFRLLPDGRAEILTIVPINNGALYHPCTAHDPRLPAGLSDCYVVGISGNCGGGCPVLREGRCETQDEMETALPLDIQEQLGRARLVLAMAGRDR